jgi:hypothetical protein
VCSPAPYVRDASDCKWTPSAQAAFALACQAPGTGYSGSGELLEHDLCRSEERLEGQVPEALLARKSPGGRGDGAGEASRDVTFFFGFGFGFGLRVVRAACGCRGVAQAGARLKLGSDSCELWLSNNFQ